MVLTIIDGYIRGNLAWPLAVSTLDEAGHITRLHGGTDKHDNLQSSRHISVQYNKNSCLRTAAVR